MGYLFCVNNGAVLLPYYIYFCKNNTTNKNGDHQCGLTTRQLITKMVSFDSVSYRLKEKKDNLKNVPVYSDAKSYHQ